MVRIPEIEAFLRDEQRLYAAAGLPAPRNMDLTVKIPTGPLAIRIAVFGPDDAPPLVWVHGGGAFGAQFARMLAAVEKATPGAFRHLVMDRPGCGASDAFTYWNEPDLRQHAIAVLRGVLDSLSIQCAGFIGNSMGGLWSLWFAHEFPARVSGLVLPGVPAVLLETSAPFPTRLCATPWIGLRLMRLGAGTREQAVSVWARLGHPDATRVGDELIELSACAVRIPYWAESFVSILNKILCLGGARISFGEDDWKRVTPPVHLVWGDRDPCGDAATARRAVGLRPGTKLDVIKGGGHAPWLDDADACAHAVTQMFAGHAANGEAPRA